MSTETAGPQRSSRTALVAVVLVLSLVAGFVGYRLVIRERDPRFDRADMAEIVLQPQDAYPGTEYVARDSGEQDIDAFAIDAEEHDRLEEDGFVAGRLSLFVPVGYAEPAPGLPPLEADAIIIQGIAGLFGSSRGADSTIARFVGDLTAEQLYGERPIDADSLGDRSFGFEGEVPTGAHVVEFVWRQGNLVLAVVGSGDISAAEVRELADSVSARAEALA